MNLEIPPLPGYFGSIAHPKAVVMSGHPGWCASAHRYVIGPFRDNPASAFDDLDRLMDGFERHWGRNEFPLWAINAWRTGE